MNTKGFHFQVSINLVALTYACSDVTIIAGAFTTMSFPMNNDLSDASKFVLGEDGKLVSEEGSGFVLHA